MLQPQTLTTVADNSGAKIVRIFKILGSTRRRYARLGDVVVASVQTAEPRKQVKKKDVVRAVVVRQKAAYRRRDGSYIRFDDNAVVVIDQKGEPRATRIFGPIPREVVEKGFQKIATMASEVV
ncbi:50S ribosomal protein L14 [Candidatus Parcubacteria bacterium]|nr:MAG: 50S ribosomal protein L14 [Candidatus Parcubacteria bacterium]GIW68834.1 MAG: 50S ribosomal protein L14 [Candidatus Parcubacteria bacterium]